MMEKDGLAKTQMVMDRNFDEGFSFVYGHIIITEHVTENRWVVDTFLLWSVVVRGNIGINFERFNKADVVL